MKTIIFFTLASLMFFSVSAFAEKVGIIGDIHCNKDSFDKSVSQLKEMGATHVILTGDLINYDITCNTKKFIPYIKDQLNSIGISDDKMKIALGNWEDPEDGSNKSKSHAGLVKGIKETLDKTFKESMRLTNSAEGSGIFLVGGKRIKVTHVPPINLANKENFKNNCNGLETDVPIYGSKFHQKETLPEDNVDLQVFGDTHMRLSCFTKNGVPIINPGALIAPPKKTGVNSYALFDTNKEEVVFYDPNTGKKVDDKETVEKTIQLCPSTFSTKKENVVIENPPIPIPNPSSNPTLIPTPSLIYAPIQSQILSPSSKKVEAVSVSSPISLSVGTEIVKNVLANQKVSTNPIPVLVPIPAISPSIDKDKALVAVPKVSLKPNPILGPSPTLLVPSVAPTALQFVVNSPPKKLNVGPEIKVNTGLAPQDPRLVPPPELGTVASDIKKNTPANTNSCEEADNIKSCKKDYEDFFKESFRKFIKDRSDLMAFRIVKAYYIFEDKKKNDTAWGEKILKKYGPENKDKNVPVLELFTGALDQTIESLVKQNKKENKNSDSYYTVSDMINEILKEDKNGTDLGGGIDDTDLYILKKFSLKGYNKGYTNGDQKKFKLFGGLLDTMLHNKEKFSLEEVDNRIKEIKTRMPKSDTLALTSKGGGDENLKNNLFITWTSLISKSNEFSSNDCRDKMKGLLEKDKQDIFNCIYSLYSKNENFGDGGYGNQFSLENVIRVLDKNIFNQYVSPTTRFGCRR